MTVRSISPDGTDARATHDCDVCVCTSYSADAEPRAPRHAATIARMNPAVRVTFVECLPFGESPRPVPAIDELPNIHRLVCHFATRRSGLHRLLLERALRAVARIPYMALGKLNPGLLHPRATRLARMLREINAEAYVGHNIDTLLPVIQAAQTRNSVAVFDCMEYYSDMGDGQTPSGRRLVRQIEANGLGRCQLVLTSSDLLSDALVSAYGIKRPLALYNAPPLEAHRPQHVSGTRGFQLYWRNSVLGFGQRGLEDALAALVLLPSDITLHVQGRLPPDGGAMLRTRISQLGLDSRVVIHPPYLHPDAVREASAHSVGLCLEREGNRNHELTVSNKIFDYLMGGLPVVASDLPALRSIVDRSEAGVVYQPGSAPELALKVRTLYDDPVSLRRLSTNAREFAVRTGNLEHEMKKLSEALPFVMNCLAGRNA